MNLVRGGPTFLVRANFELKANKNIRFITRQKRKKEKLKARKER
jgi:hypothetical protein